MLPKVPLLLAAALQASLGQGEPEGSAAAALGRSASAGGADVYEGAAGALAVDATRVPSAEIRIDGRLGDEDWVFAPILTGFTQYDPVEGLPSTQRTEVRVLVTDEAILLAVRAHDDEEGGVRATLARRDGFGGSDDYVRFILDTFDDQRRAFVFQVNPLGIQGDGLWVEGQGGRGDPIDWNPDFLWESAGKVDEGGYTVEIRIPLESLRFPEVPLQDWGFQVVRQIQRSGFAESWAPITGEVANRLAQAGKLRDLRNLEPGRFLEVNPVFTGTRQGRWDSGAGSFSRGPASGAFGLNATYGLTPNLTLDATYNPDFSQVEADAGQIAVNERFALYLPEKRPFFLEGTDAFGMPRQLVYTRSIANPVGAAKLSGKVGSFTLAYIGAVDQVADEAESPLVNLLRVKKDVGQGSSVGLAYTDRTLPGERFNRVLGADGRFVVGQRYTVEVLAAGSADGSSGERTAYGSLVRGEVGRSGRSFTLGGSFEDATEDFRARSGFIRRAGVTQVDARTGYTFRGAPGALVERWGPSLSVDGVWNRSDFWSGRGPEEMDLRLSLSLSLRGNLGGFLSYSRTSYAFGAEGYGGLFVASGEGDGLVPFAPSERLFAGMGRVSARAWISRWERARLSLGAGWGKTPIFASGVPADVGETRSADVDLTLYPSSGLSLGMGLRHSALFRVRDGSEYSSATIPRLQARYQFTRALSLRAIGEYSSQTRGALLDPVTGGPLSSCPESCRELVGTDVHDLRVEILLGYEPSPGSVVYLGYSRQMRDPAAFGFRNVVTRADGLFLKVSYRFRM